MKTIKTLSFATLVALAAALLFQTSITRADDNGKRDEHGQPAKVTFTKWISAFPNLPGLIANMEGVVGGDVGDGIFTGEVLKLDSTTNPGVVEIVAFYRFNGPQHSFTALNHVVETADSNGVVTAVITGVVTDGWLKGHAVKGEFTVIKCDHFGLIAPKTSNCFQGTLEIQRDSRD